MSSSHWTQIIAGAKIRGLDVSITHQDCVDLFEAQDSKCALTGVPICFNSIGSRSDGTASLDRIDSTLGYVKGNIQWVHKDLQKMKWDMPQDQFILQCSLVSDHHRKNKSP